jgi:DNA-binding winged helix-turn-helix (wHTH) protein
MGQEAQQLQGTVADVIAEILRNSQGPLTRDEIIKKVLERRMVKKATIILALMNKSMFEKTDGKYALIQN